MKNFLILAAITLLACNNPAKNGEAVKHEDHETEHATAVLQLNNGSKWKADEPTRVNVAAMKNVVNDNSYADETRRQDLYNAMQVKLDTLVRQCKMEGADHDALHVWLEKVMDDMKELKDPDSNYSESLAALKSDVLRYDDFFE